VALGVLSAPALRLCAAGANGDISADQLLELKLAQAESLEALDSAIETTVDSNGSSVTTRSRIAFDKVAGTLRSQKLDEDGAVNVDVKAEGTDMYFKRNDGTWELMPMDAQTRATLVEQGVVFPADGKSGKNMGLAGHGRLPKDPAAKKAAKKLNIQKELKRLQSLGRFERKVEMDQDTPRDVMAGVDLDTPLGFEADGLLNTAAAGKRTRTGKSRALLQSLGALDAKTGTRKQAQGFDAVLELIDEDTGVPVEMAHFMRVDRVKGMLDIDGTGGNIDVPLMPSASVSAVQQKHPALSKKLKLPGWARKMKDADGVDMVELQRTKVLKLRRVGGSVVPEETEQVDMTAAGEVRQRVKWKQLFGTEK
jgi:hypothetical protein